MRVAVELLPMFEPARDESGRAPLHERARRLPGTTVVIIDVLRATTTLTVAVAHGARRILPFSSAAEALGERDRTAGTLVCGERDGRIVPGFDLGNSPLEYTPERVGGRSLAFASTNGSLAMRAVRRCRRRVLAAFVNAAAVVDAVAREPDILMLCSGRLGRFSLEDGACAGLLCRRLVERGATLEGPDARFAAAIAPRDAAETRALVEGASHGRYLTALGPAFAADVRYCGQLDVLDCVAEVRDADLSAAGPATS